VRFACHQPQQLGAAQRALQLLLYPPPSSLVLVPASWQQQLAYLWQLLRLQLLRLQPKQLPCLLAQLSQLELLTFAALAGCLWLGQLVQAQQ
jgi:hypothetical protein